MRWWNTVSVRLSWRRRLHWIVFGSGIVFIAIFSALFLAGVIWAVYPAFVVSLGLALVFGWYAYGLEDDEAHILQSLFLGGISALLFLLK